MKTKAKPILFSADMVRAILAGAKTQTRRVVRPQPEFCGGMGEESDLSQWGWHSMDHQPRFRSVLDCQPWQHGDRLYVKETFRVWQDKATLYTGRLSNLDEEWRRKLSRIVEYRACTGDGGNWRPSIFMPPWLSRIMLRVVSVRVERLQDISEEDARAEGVPCEIVFDTDRGIDGKAFPVREYRNLWNSINGPGAWDANPWVWVVGFEVEKGNRRGAESAETEGRAGE